MDNMTKNNFYDIHIQREKEKESERKYECLFMYTVNDPNYDERINNNAYTKPNSNKDNIKIIRYGEKFLHKNPEMFDEKF